MIFWMISACAQVSTVYASRPTIVSPINIDVNSVNPKMEISLPSELQTGYLALIIRDQYNREFDYIVLDADTEKISHTPSKSLIPGSRYCWNVQHFQYTSETITSEQHCFTVNQAATYTAPK